VVGRLADGVREAAEKLDQKSVRIGLFSPSDNDKSQSGGAFMSELNAALGKFVNPIAALEIKGDYGYINDPAHPGSKVVAVRAKLFADGTEKKEFAPFEGYISDASDIARLMGANVDFKDEYDPAKRNKELQDGLPPGPHKSPKHPAFVHGRGDTLVSPTKDSPYAVEIRTLLLADFGKQKAGARQAELVDGEPFVEIEKDELYEVRALNYSDHEVAVSLVIDGIDQFTFSDDRGEDGRPKYKHYIVDAAKNGNPGQVLINGWHKTAKKLTDADRRQGKGNELSFLVTEYGKGAASKFPTQSQGKVGTITVGFAKSYLRRTYGTVGSAAPGSTETGFGPAVESKQTPVVRTTDDPSAFVTVRYSR